MNPLRIATRKSPLAIWQAEFVAQCLLEKGVATQLVPLVSSGDTDMRPIDGTRQVGLFTKRIEQALLQDEADIAVHSLKDLPTEQDPRLMLAAVPHRETVHDSLVSPSAMKFEDLPERARVGTGSRRRAAQLLNQRPDLQILPIRGNVQTRLGKLEEGEFDAIILAEAGLVRLQMHDLPRTPLTLAQMLPAPGQGALGIEVRSDDEAANVVRQLDHPPTRAAVTTERRLLASLHGGCLAPIAALAIAAENHLTLDAVVLSQDGSERLDEHHELAVEGHPLLDTASRAADLAAASLLSRGAAELIDAQR